MTKEDIPWLLQLAKDCYPVFDTASSEKWLRHWIGKENIIAIRGDNSAVIAATYYPFWLGGKGQIELEFLCNRDKKNGAWEIIALLKFINSYKKTIGISKFYVDSIGDDISPFCKRIGGKLVGNIYVLED